MTDNDLDPARLVLRDARAGEAAAISALALRSKAMWGYSAEFIAACHDELTFVETDLANPRRPVVVACDETTLAGFYALSPLESAQLELNALFVEPVFAGRGIGSRLLRDARHRAAGLGAQTIVIHSDPNAEAFYRAMGAVTVGKRPSGSIPGRTLPMMTITL